MGVMSMIDIDVANLRSFLSGTWDGQFPSGLTSAMIPKDNGWVTYVSNRRGDRSFDGQLDMEDVYGPVKPDGSLDATHPGPNDGSLQFGEDVNFNAFLDADY